MARVALGRGLGAAGRRDASSWVLVTGLGPEKRGVVRVRRISKVDLVMVVEWRIPQPSSYEFLIIAKNGVVAGRRNGMVSGMRRTVWMISKTLILREFWVVWRVHQLSRGAAAGNGAWFSGGSDLEGEGFGEKYDRVKLEQLAGKAGDRRWGGVGLPEQV